jgi:hypothetical protein
MLFKLQRQKNERVKDYNVRGKVTVVIAMIITDILSNLKYFPIVFQSRKSAV